MTKSNLLVVVALFVAALFLGGIAYYRRGSESVERRFPKPERVDGGFRVSLSPVRRTSAGGTVTLRTRSDTVAIELRLQGLEPGANYNVHLHEGSCERGGGGGLMLEAVRSSRKGIGSSRSVVDYEELNPTMDHLVMVHRPDQHDVLCADLPAIPRLRSLTS